MGRGGFRPQSIENNLETHIDIQYEQIQIPPAVFQWFPLLGDSTTLYVTSFGCFMVFQLVFNIENRSPHLWFQVNKQSTVCVKFH